MFQYGHAVALGSNRNKEGFILNKLSSIGSFRRLSLVVSLLFIAVSGCGKFDTAQLNLAENGSRGTVLARFFQDQNIYEKELPFRNVNGYAFFEDDIVLGRIDKLSVKPLNFVLPSAKTGVLDSSEFSGIQSFAFAIEGGRLWTKGIVPYVITLAVSPATDGLKSAMQAITSNTGIKFVERTNETDYLEFVKSDQETLAALMLVVRAVLNRFLCRPEWEAAGWRRTFTNFSTLLACGTSNR